MKEPWQPECTVDAALAAALVETHVPALAPARVRPLGAGWDNTAYVVNDAWVFRFPRRAIAVELLRTEAALLPALAARLPLPIPIPVHCVEGDGRFPWPFSGARFLPGRTACAARPDEATRRRAARPLGRFLAALHAVPAAEAARLGARPDGMDRLDRVRRTAQIAERAARLAERGIIADAGAWIRDAERSFPARRAATSALVHGDLYARHVLLDGDGAPAGVIDWGDAHLGDPAIDLALAHGFLPPSAHAAFRAAYGPIDDDTWALARFKALHSTLTVLDYGAATGDADLVAEGRAALDHLARA